MEKEFIKNTEEALQAILESYIVGQHLIMSLLEDIRKMREGE